MAAKSEYASHAILNHVLRNTALVSPVTVYAALYTVAPTSLLPGTEVVGTDTYLRQAATFGAPVAGVSANAPGITFPVAGAAWGHIVAVAILDDPVAGNILYFGNLGTPKDVGLGDQVAFGVGALTVTEQ